MASKKIMTMVDALSHADKLMLNVLLATSLANAVTAVKTSNAVKAVKADKAVKAVKATAVLTEEHKAVKARRQAGVTKAKAKLALTEPLAPDPSWHALVEQCKRQEPLMFTKIDGIEYGLNIKTKNLYSREASFVGRFRPGHKDGDIDFKATE